MAIPEWKTVLLLFAAVVLISLEVMWQWWWWRLDHIGGTNDTCLPGNYNLIGNDSTTIKCQPCRTCGTGMKLSPPCGSTLTLDTIVICAPIATHATKRIPRKTYLPTKAIKLTYLKHGKGTNNLQSRNGNVLTWSPLEVNDIYKTERLDDSNFSKMDDVDFEHFVLPKSSKAAIPRITSAPPRKYSLPYTIKRWEKKHDDKSLLFSSNQQQRPKGLIQQLKRPKHFTTPYISPEVLHETSPNTTWRSQIINITYVLGGFPWAEVVAFVAIALIFALFVLAVWLLYSVRHIIWKKKCRGYQKLSESEESIEEMSYSSDNSDHINVKNSTDLSTSPVDLKGLKLSELPPDLEDILVERLDVRRKGERFYGWQEVGAAFKICRDELRHLKIEYKRENGSPTSKLLLKLGTCKCATVSDLVNVLNGRRVNRPDIASLVIQSIQAISNSPHE